MVIKHVTVLAPSDSPNTDGIDPGMLLSYVKSQPLVLRNKMNKKDDSFDDVFVSIFMNFSSMT